MTTKLFLTKFAGAALKSPDVRSGVFVSVFLAAFMNGCAMQEAPKIPVVVPVTLAPKPVALTVEADAALKAAEQSVLEARIKRALWTAAVEELKRAQAAARDFDSAATLAHASETIALCGLSVAQLSKAPVKW